MKGLRFFVRIALALLFGNQYQTGMVWAFSSTQRTTKEGNPRTVSTIPLGYQDKEIDIYIPETPSSDRKSSRGPSNFALSRLIAHCPDLVEERNVLELGSGLGMVSAVACKYSRPNHVAITDADKALLSLAYASCVQLQRSKTSVSRCCMDWKQPSTWPRQEYDMLLGADILHDKPSILPLVNVIQHYLCNDVKPGQRKQAVIVDPLNGVNRYEFSSAAKRAGLSVDQTEFPGSPDLMLLSVSPAGN